MAKSSKLKELKMPGNEEELGMESAAEEDLGLGDEEMPELDDEEMGSGANLEDVSDEDLMAEIQKRGLEMDMGEAEPEDEEMEFGEDEDMDY